MARTTHSATRNPRLGTLQLDPDREYVSVQADVDSIQYTSPAYALLSMASPSDPSQDMYREENVEARVLGNHQLRLLSCSKEDHRLSMLGDAQEAEAREFGLNTQKGVSAKNNLIKGESESFQRDKNLRIEADE